MAIFLPFIFADICGLRMFAWTCSHWYNSLSFSQGESRQNHDVLVASLQFGNDHHWPYNILDEDPPINESSPSLPKFPHFILFPCLLALNVSAHVFRSPNPFILPKAFHSLGRLSKTFQADEIRHGKNSPFLMGIHWILGKPQAPEPGRPSWREAEGEEVPIEAEGMNSSTLPWVGGWKIRFH